MLREFVQKHHVKFVEEAEDWKDAVRLSCEVLEADGTVEENYKEEIIACIEKYGPYIVVAPNIAIPHSQEGAKGVKKTEIAFMKLEKPVSFEPGNKEMDVQLFFTLASCDPSQHLDNISRLSEMLCNEELVQELNKVKTEQELLRLQEKYLD